LGAYQLFDDGWAAHALQGLYGLPVDKFRLFLEAPNRCKLLEAFSTADILRLAYSRWRGGWSNLPTPPTVRAERLGEVVLDRAKSLPPAMQLKLVISDTFSIVCNYDVMEARSLFIRDAPVDETGRVPTMHLPFAASFPQSEVVEFFKMLDAGAALTPDYSWKLQFVASPKHDVTRFRSYLLTLSFRISAFSDQKRRRAALARRDKSTELTT
jgi:hypothetical protein